MTGMMGKMIGAAILAALPLAATAQDSVKVDPAIAKYEKTSGVSGALSSIGSDTLNNLMTLWNESFRAVYPSVQVQVEGKGSSTAPPALTEGTAQLGPMSRPMSEDEIKRFEDKHGYKPTAIPVALDALAVFVNKDNPLTKLTMPQVDAIFSRTRKLGAADVTTWGQLGLTGPWANQPLSLYGRNSASGTYGFFKEHALAKGDYKETVKEQPGSSSVVNGVANDRNGIGYSGIGYMTPGVKALALAKDDKDEAHTPTYENVLSQKYPLSRALLIYVAKAPNKPLDPAVREFLKFVLSAEGQAVVVKDGYLPLPAAVVAKQLELLK